MNVNYYRCPDCGATMHCKARWGSKEIMSGSLNLQMLQSHMLGRIVDDPGRPEVDPENITGRKVEENSANHNATLITDYDGKFTIEEKYRRPVHVRTEPAKDLEIRITLIDEPPTKREAIEELELLVKCLTRPADGEKNEAGLTQMDVAMLKCYMTGGHDWILYGKQIDGHGPIVEV